MLVVAYWLRHASPEQMVELGSEMVGQGVQMQTGQAERPRIEVQYESQLLAQTATQGQKWVA
jgi:hypothetical protein